ncbi:MAG: M48 family metalloprotease [Candidatus Aramenus sp.]|jgi:Zn-dependent protease with chaperone function|nr:M48 family metalloprotease [Candidatus Aramenus sp.]
MSYLTFGLLSLSLIYVVYFAVSALVSKRHPEVRVEGVDEIRRMSGVNFKLKLKEDPRVNAFSLVNNVIVVTSSLLHLKEEEILAAIAHEVGHLKMRHHLKSLAIISAVVLSFFLLLGSLPLALAVSLLGIVIQRYLSRQFEVEADKFASGLVDKHSLITLIMNYGETSSSFLSTHPSSVARIKKIIYIE